MNFKYSTLVLGLVFCVANQIAFAQKNESKKDKKEVSVYGLSLIHI